MHLNYNQAKEVMQNAEVLFTQKELEDEITRIALEIEHDINGDIPVFLSIMNGGLFFTANLLKQIKSPVLLDYVHASRYGDSISGSTYITWYRQPKVDLIKNRNVYLVDDILDEGYTLAEIKRFLMDVGAKSCKIVVLVDKNIGKEKPVIADYVGVTSPNKFLFGYGMDIYGLYRQLPEIYAVTG